MFNQNPHRQSMDTFKAVLIGRSRSGKSVFLQQAVSQKGYKSSRYLPTKRFRYEFVTFKVSENKTVRLIIWDTGGAKSLQHKIPLYAEKSDAMLMFVDGSKDIEIIKQELKESHALIRSVPNRGHKVCFFIVTHAEDRRAIDLTELKSFVEKTFGYYPEDCVYPYSAIQEGSHLVAKAILDHVRVAIQNPKRHNQFNHIFRIDNYDELCFFKKYWIRSDLKHIDTAGAIVLDEIKLKLAEILLNIKTIYSAMPMSAEGIVNGVNIKTKLYHIDHFVGEIHLAKTMQAIRTIIHNIQDPRHKMDVAFRHTIIPNVTNSLTQRRGIFPTKIETAFRAANRVLSRLVEDEKGYPRIDLNALDKIATKYHRVQAKAEIKSQTEPAQPFISPIQ